MPIDFGLSAPEVSESKFLLDEGDHEAKVLDIAEAGYSTYKPGTKQIMFTFKVDDVEVRDWANNTWWFDDPQPSKLYKIYKAAGMVDKDNTRPSDANEIIGKTVGIEVSHKKDSNDVMRAKIRSYHKVMK